MGAGVRSFILYCTPVDTTEKQPSTVGYDDFTIGVKVQAPGYTWKESKWPQEFLAYPI